MIEVFEVLSLDITRLWLSMALITFAMVCYSDFKEKKIDGRRNSLMNGAGLMATIPLGLGFVYLLHIFVVLIFNKVFNKLNKARNVTFFAKGDQSLLLWVLPGLILLGVTAPWVFMVVLAILLVGIFIIQAKFNEVLGKKIPGALIMAIAFLITIGFFI